MNSKNNQRARLSRMLLQNALLDLLKEKGSINKISVRELCERAELNRSTFYAHYSEPNDLLMDMENEIIRSTGEYMTNIGKENNVEAHKYLSAFLDYIKQNDKQFRVLLIELDDGSFRRRFMQTSVIQFVHNMNITLDPRFEQYVYSYILNGCSGIIIQWIRNDYQLTVDDLCDFLFEINRSTLMNLTNDSI